jgi:hypothetical protein
LFFGSSHGECSLDRRAVSVDSRRLAAALLSGLRVKASRFSPQASSPTVTTRTSTPSTPSTQGLNKKNYTYFIVDEPCFTGRTADGSLIENKTTWPTGLKKFGEALRTHGMKLGTYTCVGTSALIVCVLPAS